VQKNQSVADVAVDVLARQARTHAEQSVEPFEEASRAVLELEAGRQFGELRDGPHGDEGATHWQKSMSRERADERHRDRAG
jgi:hypothetical protein